MYRVYATGGTRGSFAAHRLSACGTSNMQQLPHIMPQDPLKSRANMRKGILQAAELQSQRTALETAARTSYEENYGRYLSQAQEALPKEICAMWGEEPIEMQNPGENLDSGPPAPFMCPTCLCAHDINGRQILMIAKKSRSIHSGIEA